VTSETFFIRKGRGYNTDRSLITFLIFRISTVFLYSMKQEQHVTQGQSSYLTGTLGCMFIYVYRALTARLV